MFPLGNIIRKYGLVSIVMLMILNYISQQDQMKLLNYIEQPQAQHPPTSTHYYEFTSPPEVWDLLVSDASWYHHREAQNHSPEHSRSPFLAGGMIFPPPSGLLDPCQSSSNNWKLISFNSTWLHHKKKKKTFTFSKSSSFSLSFSPSLASLYLFEQCLRLGVMGTSSVCLPLLD